MPIKLDHAPRPEESFLVEIEELGPKGRGRGWVDAEVGPQKEQFHYEFIVRKGVPGDVVHAVVDRRKKRRVEAHIGAFVERSAMRIEPRCPHFGRRVINEKGCGGCTLQSLSYRHQLAVKERQIKRYFSQVGLDPGAVRPLQGMDDPWYYRNKMEFSFGDNEDREFAFGLHPSGFRYEVLNLDVCYLQSRFVSAMLPKIRHWAESNELRPFMHREGFLRTCTIREGKRTGESLIELVTTQAEMAHFRGEMTPAEDIADSFRDFILEASAEAGSTVDSIYWTQQRAVRGEPTVMIEHLLYGEPFLHEELHLPDGHVLRFEIHPRAFFQPSTRGAEMIYESVIEAAAVDRDAVVLDLYCGTGTIGMCLAPYAERVVGVELRPEAVENARRNSSLNGLENIEFYCGDVGDVLQEQGLEGDVVIVDPPRSGLMPKAKDQLRDVAAERMVYVSCNPAALARDLAELLRAGWTVDLVQPIDQFPQTYHVEVVTALTRA